SILSPVTESGEGSMSKRLLVALMSGAIVTALGSTRLPAAQGTPAQNPAGAAVPPSPLEIHAAHNPAGGPGVPKKFQDFNELTKDSKKYEGFITLHEKEQHLYAEIKPHQLEQPILAP